MSTSANSYEINSHFATPERGYKAFARAVAPRKPLTVSQWSDMERRLSSKGSADRYLSPDVSNVPHTEILRLRLRMTRTAGRQVP